MNLLESERRGTTPNCASPPTPSHRRVSFTRRHHTMGAGLSIFARSPSRHQVLPHADPASAAALPAFLSGKRLGLTSATGERLAVVLGPEGLEVEVEGSSAWLKLRGVSRVRADCPRSSVSEAAHDPAAQRPDPVPLRPVRIRHGDWEALAGDSARAGRGQAAVAVEVGVGRGRSGLGAAGDLDRGADVKGIQWCVSSLS